MKNEDLLKIAGLYLIFDGFISMLMFPNQPLLYHLPRVIRIIAGVFVFNYTGGLGGED